MIQFSVNDIPEFQHFRTNTQLRDAIYAERGLEGLADFLQQQVLRTYDPHSHLQTKTPLLQQLAKHYTNVQIAQAVSRAWLDNSDTFSLPKLGFVQRYGKVKIAAIGTFLTVVPFMTWLTLELRKDYPEVIGALLVLEPLLALPGAVASVAVFWLVMRYWK